MAYEFATDIVAKVKVSSDASGQEAIQLGGVNGRETDANIIMSGISSLFDVVGWQVGAVTRIVNQEVQKTE